MNAADVARLTRVSYRQVDYWTRCGYLQPGRDKTGSGYPRDYDEAQVKRVWMMGQLVDVGFTPLGAYTVARQLETRCMASLGRVLHVLWLQCELCGDWLAPGQEFVHPECQAQEQADLRDLRELELTRDLLGDPQDLLVDDPQSDEETP